MSAELEKRLLAVLDREGGLEADPRLRAALAADPALGRLADDLIRQDRALRSLPEARRLEIEWEGIAAKIQQALDQPLAPRSDPTRPPAFRDLPQPAQKLHSAGEPTIGDLAKRSQQTATSAVAKPALAADRRAPADERTTDHSGDHRPTAPEMPAASTPITALAAQLLAAPAQTTAERTAPAGATPEQPPPAEAAPEAASVAGPVEAARGHVDSAAAASSSTPPAFESLGPARATFPDDEADLDERIAETLMRAGKKSMPQIAPLAPLPENILEAAVEKERRRRRRPYIYGGLAAAAAVTLVFLGGQMVVTMRAPDPVVAESAGAPASRAAQGQPVTEAPLAAAPASNELAAFNAEHSQGAGEGSAPVATRPGAAAGPELPVRSSVAADRGRSAPTPTVPLTVAVPRSARPAGTTAEAPGESEPEPARPQASRPAATKRSNTSALLDQALSGTPRAGREARDEPTREEVVAALRAVQPQVSACGGGVVHGTAEVELTIGSSGRVRHAVVAGQFAGSPLGSCIARAVRNARVQPFERESVNVRFPFRF